MNELHEYAFDIELAGAIRIKAASEQAARAELNQLLDAADANLGAFANGDPILMEVSLRGRPALYEVDGEDVDEDIRVLNAINQLKRVTLEDLIDGVDGVGCNDEDNEDDMRELVNKHYLAGRISAGEILGRA